MNSGPQRQRLIALLVLLVSGVVGWLGVEWWTSRQPTHAEFEDEVARITGSGQGARSLVPLFSRQRRRGCVAGKAG